MGLLSLLRVDGAGWLSDRFAPGWLLFWFYGLRGLSLLCLPFTELSFVGLTVFATVYGLDWVATDPPTAKLLLIASVASGADGAWPGLRRSPTRRDRGGLRRGRGADRAWRATCRPSSPRARSASSRHASCRLPAEATPTAGQHSL